MSTLIGTGIFENYSTNKRNISFAEFVDYSVNEGIVTEHGIFCNNTQNKGTLEQIGLFTGNSSNKETGSVLLTAIFANNSINYGIVENAVFLDNAVNYGTIINQAIFCGNASNFGVIGAPETEMGVGVFYHKGTKNMGTIYGTGYTLYGVDLAGTVTQHIYFTTELDTEITDSNYNGAYIHGYYTNSVLSYTNNNTVYELLSNVWFTFNSEGMPLLAEGILSSVNGEINLFYKGKKMPDVKIKNIDQNTFLYKAGSIEPIIYYTDRFLTKLAYYTTDIQKSGVTKYDNINDYNWNITNDSNVTITLLTAYPFSFLEYYMNTAVPISGTTKLYYSLGTGALPVTGAEGYYNFDNSILNDGWTTDENGVLSWIPKDGYYSFGYYVKGILTTVSTAFAERAKDDDLFYIYNNENPILANGIVPIKFNTDINYCLFNSGILEEILNGVYEINGSFVYYINGKLQENVNDGVYLLAKDRLYHVIQSQKDKGIADGVFTNVRTNKNAMGCRMIKGGIVEERELTGTFFINEDYTTYYYINNGLVIGVANGLYGLGDTTITYDPEQDYWNPSVSFHYFKEGKDVGVVSRISLLSGDIQNVFDGQWFYAYYLQTPQISGLDNLQLFKDYTLTTPFSSNEFGANGGLAHYHLGSVIGKWSVQNKTSSGKSVPGTLRFSAYIDLLNNGETKRYFYKNRLASGHSKIYTTHPINEQLFVTNIGGEHTFNDELYTYTVNGDGIINWGQVFSINIENVVYFYYGDLISGKTILYTNNPPSVVASYKAGKYDFKYHSKRGTLDTYEINNGVITWRTIYEFGRKLNFEQIFSPIAFLSNNNYSTDNIFINPLYANNPPLTSQYSNRFLINNDIPSNVFFYKTAEGIVSNRTQLYCDPTGYILASSIPLDPSLACNSPDAAANEECHKSIIKNVPSVIARSQAWQNKVFSNLEWNVPQSVLEDLYWDPNNLLVSAYETQPIQTEFNELTSLYENIKENKIAWNEQLLNNVKINLNGVLCFSNLTAAAGPPYSLETGPFEYYTTSSILQDGTQLYIDKEATIPASLPYTAFFDVNNDNINDVFFVTSDGKLNVSYVIILDQTYYYRGNLESGKTQLYVDANLSIKASSSFGTKDFNSDGILDAWRINDKGILSWELSYSTIVLNGFPYEYTQPLQPGASVLYTSIAQRAIAPELSGLYVFSSTGYLDFYTVNNRGIINWVPTKKIEINANNTNYIYFYNGDLISEKTVLYQEDMLNVAPILDDTVCYISGVPYYASIKLNGVLFFQNISNVTIENITYYFVGNSLINGVTKLYLDNNLSLQSNNKTGTHQFIDFVTNYEINNEGIVSWTAAVTLTGFELSGVFIPTKTPAYTRIGVNETFIYPGGVAPANIYKYDAPSLSKYLGVAQVNLVNDNILPQVYIYDVFIDNNSTLIFNTHFFGETYIIGKNGIPEILNGEHILYKGTALAFGKDSWQNSSSITNNFPMLVQTPSFRTFEWNTVPTVYIGTGWTNEFYKKEQYPAGRLAIHTSQWGYKSNLNWNDPDYSLHLLFKSWNSNIVTTSSISSFSNIYTQVWQSTSTTTNTPVDLGEWLVYLKDNSNKYWSWQNVNNNIVLSYQYTDMVENSLPLSGCRIFSTKGRLSISSVYVDPNNPPQKLYLWFGKNTIGNKECWIEAGAPNHIVGVLGTEIDPKTLASPTETMSGYSLSSIYFYDKLAEPMKLGVGWFNEQFYYLTGTDNTLWPGVTSMYTNKLVQAEINSDSKLIFTEIFPVTATSYISPKTNKSYKLLDNGEFAHYNGTKDHKTFERCYAVRGLSAGETNIQEPLKNTKSTFFQIFSSQQFPLNTVPWEKGGKIQLYSHNSLYTDELTKGTTFLIKPSTNWIENTAYASITKDYAFGIFPISMDGYETTNVAALNMLNNQLVINYPQTSSLFSYFVNAPQQPLKYFYFGKFADNETLLYENSGLTTPVTLALGKNDLVQGELNEEPILEKWQIINGNLQWSVGKKINLIGKTQYYHDNLTTGTILYENALFNQTNNGITSDGIASNSTFYVSDKGVVSWFERSYNTITLEGIQYFYTGELISGKTILYIDSNFNFRAPSTTGRDYSYSLENFFAVNGTTLQGTEYLKVPIFTINELGVLSWIPYGVNSIILNSTKYFYRGNLSRGSQLYTDVFLTKKAFRTTSGNQYLTWEYPCRVILSQTVVVQGATVKWFITEGGTIQFAVNNSIAKEYDVYTPNSITTTAGIYYFYGSLIQGTTQFYTNSSTVIDLIINPDNTAISKVVASPNLAYFIDAHGAYNRLFINNQGVATWGIEPTKYNVKFNSLCIKNKEYYYIGEQLINGSTRLYEWKNFVLSEASPLYGIIQDINFNGYPEIIQIDSYGILRWQAIPLEFRPNPSLKYYFVGELLSNKTVLYEDRDLTTIASDIHGIFDATELPNEPLTLQGQSGYPYFYPLSIEYPNAQSQTELPRGAYDYKPTGYNGNTNIGGNYYWVGSYYTPGKLNSSAKQFKIENGIFSWSSETAIISSFRLGVTTCYYSSILPLSSGKVKLYSIRNTRDNSAILQEITQNKNLTATQTGIFNEQSDNILFNIDEQGRFAYTPKNTNPLFGYYSKSVNKFYVNTRTYYYIGNKIINNFTVMYEDSKLITPAYDTGVYSFNENVPYNFKLIASTGVITWNPYFNYNGVNYIYDQKGTFTPGRTTIYNITGNASSSPLDLSVQAVLNKTYNSAGVQFLPPLATKYGYTFIQNQGNILFQTDEWGRINFWNNSNYNSPRINLNGAVYTYSYENGFTEGVKLWTDLNKTKPALPVYNGTLSFDSYFIPQTATVFDIKLDGRIYSDYEPKYININNVGTKWYFTGPLNSTGTTFFKDKEMKQTMSYDFNKDGVAETYSIDGVSGKLTVYEKGEKIKLGNADFNYSDEFIFNKTVLSATDKIAQYAMGKFDFNNDGFEETYTIKGNGTLSIELINSIQLNNQRYYYKGPLQSSVTVFYLDKELTNTAPITIQRINNFKEKIYSFYSIDGYGTFTGINDMILDDITYYFKDNLISGQTVFYNTSALTETSKPRRGFAFVFGDKGPTDIIDQYNIEENGIFSWSEGKSITLNGNVYFYAGVLNNRTTILYKDRFFKQRAGATQGTGDFTIWSLLE